MRVEWLCRSIVLILRNCESASVARISPGAFYKCRRAIPLEVVRTHTVQYYTIVKYLLNDSETA
jgi:hypothetical protein